MIINLFPLFLITFISTETIQIKKTQTNGQSNLSGMR